MKQVLTAMLVAAALIGSASAQPEATPRACRANAQGVIDWRACLDASPAGSNSRMLALINLGTESYLQEDFAAAVRFYDEAAPPSGQQMYSDVTFHAFRGAAYWHVGRREEAQRDAGVAFRMLHRDPTLPGADSLNYLPNGFDREMVYALLLQVWQAGDQAQFQTALREFRALPAGDWISYANRAAVLDQINDPGALEMSTRAIAMVPNEPNALNNHCYILYRAGHSSEALPYCERALAGAPDVAAVRDSLSDVLAALGRCEEAAEQIAEAQRLDPSAPEYREPLQCTPSAN